MRAVGHDRYCLDIEHFDVDTLIESFESMVGEREYLGALFRKTSATYRDALRTHFDDLFGRGVVARTKLAERESTEVVAWKQWGEDGSETAASGEYCYAGIQRRRLSC